MALLLSFLVFLSLYPGCAPLPYKEISRHEAVTVAGEEGKETTLFAPCTRGQAERWAVASGESGLEALRAANCYAFLAGHGEDKSLRLADAIEGRKMAQTAIAFLPRSGTAHYLHAYLTGMEARNDPVRGLELVPVMEKEALLASELEPALDHGGPYRMLGELYLRAPAFPVSVGDTAKAVEFYRRAVGQDPRFLDNRLGLAEALLEDEDTVEACVELRGALAEMPPGPDLIPMWKRSLGLLERLCKEMENE